MPREAHRRRARAAVALVVERPLRVPDQQRELQARPSVSANRRAPASTAGRPSPRALEPRRARAPTPSIASRRPRAAPLRAPPRPLHLARDAARASPSCRARAAHRATARSSSPPRWAAPARRAGAAAAPCPRTYPAPPNASSASLATATACFAVVGFRWASAAGAARLLVRDGARLLPAEQLGGEHHQRRRPRAPPASPRACPRAAALSATAPNATRLRA